MFNNHRCRLFVYVFFFFLLFTSRLNGISSFSRLQVVYVTPFSIFVSAPTTMTLKSLCRNKHRRQRKKKGFQNFWGAAGSWFGGSHCSLVCECLECGVDLGRLGRWCAKEKDNWRTFEWLGIHQCQWCHYVWLSILHCCCRAWGLLNICPSYLI